MKLKKLIGTILAGILCLSINVIPVSAYEIDADIDEVSIFDCIRSGATEGQVLSKKLFKC